MNAPGPAWSIGPVRHTSATGTERVEADLAGAPLWFESADAPLDAGAEAFATVLFQPALAQGAGVAVEAPLDPVWLAGTARLPALYASWWGWGDRYPITARASDEPAPTPATAGAVCFTGGVDSFYSVLTPGRRFERLLYVHGYDIPLADRARLDAFDVTLREVAAAVGATPLRLRTNVREHPVAASVNWELTHGAALAAAGLVAAPAIGSLTIPSSYRRELLRPWGSHPETDPAWSTRRVAIVHDDWTFGREAKLAAIVDQPLVAKHLRVCWQNVTSAANCSACLKCVRTMIALAAYRRLDAFTTFDRSVPVATRIDGLRSVSGYLLPPYRTLLALDLPADVRAALERLLARSEPVHGVKRWLRAAARRTGLTG